MIVLACSDGLWAFRADASCVEYIAVAYFLQWLQLTAVRCVASWIGIALLRSAGLQLLHAACR